MVRRGFLHGGARPAAVAVLGSSIALGVIDVETKGRGGRARRGSFPNPDSDAMRPVKQPRARRAKSDEEEEKARVLAGSKLGSAFGTGTGR